MERRELTEYERTSVRSDIEINSTEHNAKSSLTPSRTRVEMNEVEDFPFFQFNLMGRMEIAFLPSPVEMWRTFKCAVVKSALKYIPA